MDVKFVTRFSIIWAVNTVVIWLGWWFSPVDIVLGNGSMMPPFAALLSGFLLTLGCKLVKPLLVSFGVKEVKGRFKMFALYFFANTFLVWVLARFADFTGLGISSYFAALGLGVSLTFAQWLTRQGLKASPVFKK